MMVTPVAKAAHRPFRNCAVCKLICTKVACKVYLTTIPVPPARRPSTSLDGIRLHYHAPAVVSFEFNRGLSAPF